MKIPFIVGALSTAAFAAAFDGVVPNAFAATEAPGVFSLTSTAAGGRTYQFIIDSSQLTSFVGSNLTGMAFRLNNASTGWPVTTAASFTAWDIEIGPGVDPTVTSNTFAANFTSTPTLVRSGPLSFAAGSFDGSQTGATPEAFGPTIGFTSNYFYAGGDLSVIMRFASQTGNTTQAPFDAIAATDTANGWGTLFSGRWTGSSAGTTGGNANFIVTRFSATVVPEPASLAALGIGAVALLRRRRK